MPPTDTQPILQPCSGCATLLDITEEEPFAQVICPLCRTSMRVRKQFNNFMLQDILGAGGMGSVYRAMDVTLNRAVALKLLRKEFSANAEYIAKFEMEAKITASINHPHVVKVFSYGSDRGLVYIAMELVDKGSLDDLMSLQKRVAEVQTLEVGIQIAQGLQAAHRVGLIHRDVKPGNILFADAHTSKIVDFGLALLVEHEAESRGEVWGTPYYVAPEKLNHEPEDFRSDIYSLGGTLFHAVAGRPPFEAETASMVALKHIKSQAVSLQTFAPDVTSATAYVINRMLHKEPDERYQSYDELIEHFHYARAKLVEASARPRQPKARVVVESEAQQRAMGIMTWVLLGLIVLIAFLGYSFRDRLFKKGGPVSESQPHPTPKLTESAVRSLEDKYQEARKQLIDGDFASTQENFRQLGQEQGIPQPLHKWISFHEGLAALLADRASDATAIFKALHEGGLYSDQPGQTQLANFFVETGRLLADDKPIPADTAKNYNKTNNESLALFAFALKDWTRSRFEDAAPLMEQFVSSEPAEEFAWIADYKPLAKKFQNDLAIFSELHAKLTAADTREKKSQLLVDLKTREKQLQARGKMSEAFAAMRANLEKKLTDENEQYASQIARAAAEKRHGELKVLETAHAKYATLCATFAFEEARAAINNAAVTDAEAVTQKAALLKKADWLIRFKAQLIADVNAVSYPAPVIKRTGVSVPGGVRKASSAQIEIITPYGSIPVAWNELSPATLFSMGTYFAKAAGATEAGADRMWLAGVFASEIGLAKEGYPLLLQAVQSKPAYREQLALFPEPTAQ